MSKISKEEIVKELETYGYKLIEYKDSKNVIFICKCLNERKTSLLRIRKGQKCRSCKSNDFIPQNSDDEKWEQLADRWISSKGKVLLENGLEAKLDYSNGRLRFHSTQLNKHLQVNRSMVIAFKLPRYNLLEDDDNLNVYEVSYKDGNKNNLTIDNLIVVHKNENETRKGKCHFYNERVCSVRNINENEIKEENDVKTLSQFPKYHFYKNGMIFHKGSNQPGSDREDGYIAGSFIMDDNKVKALKHHRLICMAFNPIE